MESINSEQPVKSSEPAEKPYAFHPHSWAAVEHFMIGSTPPFKDKKSETLGELMSSVRAGDKDARIRLLRPLALVNGTGSQDEIIEDRRLEREHRTKAGMMPFFVDEQISLLMEGNALFLEPSELDAEGLVIPEWKVRLLDTEGKPIKGNEKFLNLGMREELKDVLEFRDTEKSSREGYRVLHLKV